MAKTYQPPKFRSAYSEPVRVQQIPEGESLTEQSHLEAVKTHNIVTRYLKTGVVDHLNTRTPLDFEVAPDIDFFTAQNMVAQGKSAFESLPAKIRREFDYDPAKFVEFATNADNIEALREMGLANPLKAAPEPQKTSEPVSPTGSGEKEPQGS